MDRRHASEPAWLLEQFMNPIPPRELIDLLGRIGVTRDMVQRATGAKSVDVVSNWAAGRTAPRPENFERLDSLRVAVSFLLQTDAFEDDDMAIAMWLNSYPTAEPFTDGAGRPIKTPLDAIRDGEVAKVVDAAQLWIDLRERHAADETDNHDRWTPA